MSLNIKSDVIGMFAHPGPETGLAATFTCLGYRPLVLVFALYGLPKASKPAVRLWELMAKYIVVLPGNGGNLGGHNGPIF
jgi:hypothetical protein